MTNSHLAASATVSSLVCSSADLATEVTGIPEDKGTALTPVERHAMPTLASLLPAYTNCEADFITGAFSTGAMHNIQDMPATLKAQAVIQRKQQMQEAAQQLLQRTSCHPTAVVILGSHKRESCVPRA